MAIIDVGKYSSLLFDCDGVLLDSNKVKTKAFYKAALPYGEDAAQRLVEYHVANGGVSRYLKFKRFLENIVPNDREGPGLESLLSNYASEVREGLLACEVAEGLVELRENTPEANWFVISGGDQQELREIFSSRGIFDLFDGGIYGSPNSKEDILRRELSAGAIKQSSLFLGDSRYDHQVASQFGIDFLFVNQWTEFEGWRDYCVSRGICCVGSVNELLSIDLGWECN